MNALSFGEILWDVYPDNKCLGGAPLNFAAHLAKHGENAYMMSAIGNDDLGEETKRKVKQWQVRDKYLCTLDNKPTGRCLVTLDENKVPSYNLLEDVAYDYIPCNELADDFDVLYFGSMALRSKENFFSLEKLLRENNFKNVFVDLNIRPPFSFKDSVRFCVKNATILKISLEEMGVVSEFLEIEELQDYKEFAKKLSFVYNNLKCIIITLGADGSYALDCAQNKGYFCACEKSEVKSTVGAGDSFSAAYLHKYVKNNEISKCLEYATKVAGFVVSRYEAVPDYNIEDFA